MRFAIDYLRWQSCSIRRLKRNFFSAPGIPADVILVQQTDSTFHLRKQKECSGILEKAFQIQEWRSTAALPRHGKGIMGWGKGSQWLDSFFIPEQELYSYWKTSIDELLAASMLEEARAGWVPTTNANGSFFLAPATLELEDGARVTLVIVIFFSPQC